jgi:hypothetical protein
VLNALGVVYLHHWVDANVDATFPFHLEVIVSLYYVSKKIHELFMYTPVEIKV